MDLVEWVIRVILSYVILFQAFDPTFPIPKTIALQANQKDDPDLPALEYFLKALSKSDFKKCLTWDRYKFHFK